MTFVAFSESQTCLIGHETVGASWLKNKAFAESWGAGWLRVAAGMSANRVLYHWFLIIGGCGQQAHHRGTEGDPVVSPGDVSPVHRTQIRVPPQYRGASQQRISGSSSTSPHGRAQLPSGPDPRRYRGRVVAA